MRWNDQNMLAYILAISGGIDTCWLLVVSTQPFQFGLVVPSYMVPVGHLMHCLVYKLK
jgi:hypothetical protein